MKDKRKQEKGAPKWMVTFSDLMTLILVFFVLLFSMSKVDAVKFLEIKEVFQGVGIGEKGYLSDEELLNINLTQKSLTETSIQKMLLQREIERKKLDNIYEKIKTYTKERGLENEMEVTRKEEGVEVTITNSIFFDTASAEVKPEAKELIDSLTDFFKQVDNEIQIEGHTDNRPIRSFKYPSNWELSGARASSIVRYLINNYGFEPSRFIAIGYGATRPIAPNDTPENMQKNRRVVIFIKDNIYNFEDIALKQKELENLIDSKMKNE